MSTWIASRALPVGVAALVIGSIGVIGIPSGARAVTYNLNVVCGDSGCGNVGPYGTVDITGTSTALTYTFNTASPADLFAGRFTSLFVDVTGTVNSWTVGATTDASLVQGATVSFNGFTWIYETGSNVNAGGLVTGAHTGGFNLGFDCSAKNGTDCGSTFSVTFTGTGLSAGSDTKGGFQMFAGADIDCGAGCTGINGGNTGVVGATVAVPSPIVGAGVPGLVAGCGGLLALARRRRQRVV